MPTHASFILEPIPPFRLDLTVWTLRRRPDNMIDRWDGQTYRRVLVEEDNPFEIAVTQSDQSAMPRLQVSVIGEVANSHLKAYAIAAIERLLGIHVDLMEFYRFCENDEVLRSPANQFRGSKPPRFPTYFETLVNAIACQQLTLTVGIRLLNRLTEACGPAIETAEGVFHAFPGPQQLANMDIEQLREMGFSYRKANYLTGLARAVIEKQIDFDEIERLDDMQAVKRLCTLKGVGRWTAEYFLLRGLGRTHIFPGDDVGARNHLQRWLRLSKPMNYDKVHKVLRRWDTFGGLIYLHLLLKSLAEKGIIKMRKVAIVRAKRVYEAIQRSDGPRFLVERLWPRGMKKEQLKLDAWLKDVAPSDGLRRWFAHDPAKWDEFQQRYRAELQANPGAWKPLLEAARQGNVTLLYSARNTEHNNAIVLKAYLEQRLAGSGEK